MLLLFFLNKEKNGIFASTGKNRLISLICAVSLRYKTCKKSPKAKKFYFDFSSFASEPKATKRMKLIAIVLQRSTIDQASL
jgi:hypothetical protein